MTFEMRLLLMTFLYFLAQLLNFLIFWKQNNLLDFNSKLFIKHLMDVFLNLFFQRQIS